MVDTNYNPNANYNAGVPLPTPAVGTPISVSPTTPISTASLTPPASPITPVQAAQTPIYPVASINTTPALTTTPQENKASTLDTQLQDLNSSLVGESAYRTQQEGTQDISGKTQTLNDLTNRLNTLKSEALAIPLSIENKAIGHDVTSGELNPVTTAHLRNNAIESLSTGALLQAAQGNLTTAQTLVDRAVAQKFDPIREQITAKTANLDLILKDPKTTIADKNRAQAQKDIQDANLRQLEQDKQNNKDVLTMATTAAGNSADFTASTSYPTLSMALKAISEAKTPQAAIQIATAAGLAGVKAKTTQLVDVGGRKLLIDSSTGQTIRDLGSSTSTGGSFTQTQINTGASNAGINQEQFNALPVEVKNAFIHNKDVAQLMVDAVASVKNGSTSRADAVKDIQGQTLPQEVKDYFTNLLPAETAENKGGGGLWGWLGSFFGG